MHRHRMIVSAAAVAVLACVASPGPLAADEAAAGAEVKLTGEVLDLHCYMLHPDTGQGAEHAKCANSCIERGLPAGFLSGGQVYVLLGPGHDAASSLVKGQAGGEVVLTGTLVEHGGMKAIQVKSVQPAKGAAEGASAGSGASEGGKHDGH